MAEFKIGQYVFYHPRIRWKADGRYVVIAVFPQSDGKVHYRIRGEDDMSREYTADASELRRATRPLG
jgi:hypothetical protein